MTIWKQGQFYPDLGKKVVDLPNKVNQGPSDPMIKIDGFHVLPDQDGNFIEGGEINYNEDELDAIHTYAIIRMVINLYEELLGKSIYWSWWKDGKGDPIIVKIRNNDINARFIKEQKCIELDYYGPYGNWTYNCRSVDLIAHETGHAILDSILPHLNEGSIESRGIGEAFCDLTAMFWILSQKDLCKHVIEETDGDLSKNSILTLFGVGYGYKVNNYRELRSAINNVKYSGDNMVTYNYSQILVGILYNIFKDLYIQTDYPYREYKKLFHVSRKWTMQIINIFQELTLENSTISIIKHKIISDFNKKK